MKYFKILVQCAAIVLVSAFTLIAKPNISSSIASTSGVQGDPSTMADEIRAFRALKYGMFIHFSLSTFDGLEQTPGSTTPASVYNPSNLDVDQWIRVAKEAGMKYAVLTAKHSSGFCLWDSKVTWEDKEFDYDVVGSGNDTTDIVAEFIAACNKYDIVPGMYYCVMDTRHSDGNVVWTPKLPYISKEYLQLMKDHLAELHTRHPEIAIQWLDIPRHLTYEERDTLYNHIRNLNPECLILFNYGKESGDIRGDYNIEVAKKVTWPTDIFNSEVYTIKRPFQEQQEYDGKTYELAYEHCISITSTWFWHPGSKSKSNSLLRSTWETTRNLNGNFLLNVPPDTSGQIPENFIESLNEFRDSVLTHVENDLSHFATEFKLSQNYPNPFNPSTVISFTIPSNNFVSLKVYDLRGAEIAELAGREYSAGLHSLTFNASKLANGEYIYELKAGKYSISKKMLLLK